MLLSTTLFSLMTLCVRLASHHVPWSEVALVRALVGALIAFVVAKALGHSLAIRDRRAVWARSLFGSLANGCTFFALSAPAIAVGDVSTLRGTAPILIAFFAAVFLGERGGRRVWLSVPLAFVGVIVLVQPQLSIAGHLAAISLLGSLFNALAMLLIRYAGPTESPEAIALHFSLTTAAVMGVISIPSLVLPSGEGALWLLACGILGGLGQLSLTRAFSTEKAGRVGALSYFGIVLTQWLAAVFLDEPIAPHQLVGSLLVVLAGLVLAGAAYLEQRQATLRMLESDSKNERVISASSSGSSS
ncbi:MAG: DMT family transporter [Myxococcales bacterium]|nr:DMT family transporter [Myxococcales bacterium]